VAIAASHIAFRDLGVHDRDAESVANELHHAVAFFRSGPMIEVEHSDVGGAAVDAGM